MKNILLILLSVFTVLLIAVNVYDSGNDLKEYPIEFSLSINNSKSFSVPSGAILDNAPIYTGMKIDIGNGFFEQNMASDMSLEINAAESKYSNGKSFSKGSSSNLPDIGSFQSRGMYTTGMGTEFSTKKAAAMGGNSSLGMMAMSKNSNQRSELSESGYGSSFSNRSAISNKGFVPFSTVESDSPFGQGTSENDDPGSYNDAKIGNGWLCLFLLLAGYIIKLKIKSKSKIVLH